MCLTPENVFHMVRCFVTSSLRLLGCDQENSENYSPTVELNRATSHICKLFAFRLCAKWHFHNMLQDDVALADVVKNLSGQLQQVQLQLADQQATITKQQAVNAEQHVTITEQQVCLFRTNS